MGHTKQPVFVIVPNLVPVQLHGQPPELLLQSSSLTSVALQFLIHLVRRFKIMLEICRGDRLFPVS